MAVVQWTSAFLDTPAGSDTPDGGDDRIRELKATLDSALDKEHTLDASSPPAIAAQGWHREGSAVAYYQAAAPTNRPDGATSLDTDDDGRLWIDSDDGTMDYWDGDSFEDLKVPEVDLIRDHLDKSADYTVLDADANTIFVTTADTDRTITLPTAADNTGRIITVKKVDDGTGTVTIDGEGAETIDGATTAVVSVQYGLWRGMCDGTTWHTIGRGSNQDLLSGSSPTFTTITMTGVRASVEVLSGPSLDGDVYDAISPSLPSVGDKLLLTGGNALDITWAYAERKDATTITLWGYRYSTSDPYSRDVSSGGGSGVEGTMAWYA